MRSNSSDFSPGYRLEPSTRSIAAMGRATGCHTTFHHRSRLVRTSGYCMATCAFRVRAIIRQVGPGDARRAISGRSSSISANTTGASASGNAAVSRPPPAPSPMTSSCAISTGIPTSMASATSHQPADQSSAVFRLIPARILVGRARYLPALPFLRSPLRKPRLRSRQDRPRRP